MKNYTILILMSAFLIACGGGGGGDDSGSNNDNPNDIFFTDEVPTTNNASPLRQVSIQDAIGLIVTDDNGVVTSAKNEGQQVALSSEPESEETFEKARKGAAAKPFDDTFEPNSLYKVLSDGTLELVTLEDASEESLRGSIEPEKISDMGNGWVLMSFNTQFEYIERDDFDQDGVFSYFLNSQQRLLVYLVHQETGAAYEASWATEPFDFDDGGDGFIDLSDGDSIQNTFGFSLNGYDRKAQFDSQGRMYTLGLVAATDNNGFATSEQRVFRIDTDNLGADTLTATVIQKVDLGEGLTEGAVRVSADGKLLAYLHQPDSGSSAWRLVNLDADASYPLSTVVDSGDTSDVMLGRDGSLYVIVEETVAWTPNDPDTFGQEWDANVMYRLDVTTGVSEPGFTRINVMNVGEEHFGDTIPDITVWDTLPDLLDAEPAGAIAVSNWLTNDIYPITNALFYTEFTYIGAASTTVHVVNGQRIFVEDYILNGDRTPSAHYIVDLPQANIEVVTAANMGFESYTSYSADDDSLFFFGKDDDLGEDYIVKWTPGLDVEIEEIDIDVSVFDVQRFKVLSNSTILLEAVILNSFSDVDIGDRVLAEASFDGTVTIIDVIEADEPNIIIMERVNQGDFISVDGSASDWAVENRIITDATGDNINHTGGDLAYLSQISDADYYWFLVELAEPLDGARFILDLTATHSIEILNSQAVFIDNATETELFSAGAIYSEGIDVIEIRVPVSLLGGSSTTASFSTEIDQSFGDAEVASDAVDITTGLTTITLDLIDAVGPETLTVNLHTDYEIRITDDNFDISDPTTVDTTYTIELANQTGVEVVTTLAAESGTYDASTADELTITIPALYFGLVATYPLTSSAVVNSDAAISAVPVDD